MAGDWIKFELATLDKPEVCQIADLADIDIDAVLGKLLRVWGWFDQQTKNGNAPSVTKKLLNRLVGVERFCEHMVAVGWMDDDGDLISLPNFIRHNGKSAKNRALTARRVANHKTTNGKANAKGNAPSVSDAAETALPREEIDISLSIGAPFSMPLEWKPPPDLLAAYAGRAGMSPDLFTDEALSPFVIYHHAKGEMKTPAQFVGLLVAWVRRDQQHAKRGGRGPAAGSAGDPDVHDKSWAEEG
ncbi:DnaT-like ssDNA-binding domain-containing protein [Pseudomonas sp.]|uniref:DnaT-like ssDNA-binding domain-containing protein n=1 Tax=Pseudomonas sp. TaxID=306 RepID=UPI003CC6DC6D